MSVFYHTGGRHGGTYYGYSSGKTGKVKIIGEGYKPLPGDKAKIIQAPNTELPPTEKAPTPAIERSAGEIKGPPGSEAAPPDIKPPAPPAPATPPIEPIPSAPAANAASAPATEASNASRTARLFGKTGGVLMRVARVLGAVAEVAALPLAVLEVFGTLDKLDLLRAIGKCYTEIDKFITETKDILQRPSLTRDNP